MIKRVTRKSWWFMTFIVLLTALFGAACTAPLTTQPVALPTATPMNPAPATVAPPTAAVPTATTAISDPAPTPVLPSCTPRTDWPTYTVATGDTLFNIAQRSGSTVGELVAANCLTNASQIAAGQVLRIPNAISGGSSIIQFVLIAPEDGGASGPLIGCNDSAIVVSSGQPSSGVLANDVEAALTALFAIRNEVYGQSGLVTALYDSSLSVASVTRNGDQVDIQLDGSLMLVGTCADARMEAQIIRTVFQFPAINRTRIMVGSQNLKQLFDGSGLVGPDYVYTRDGVAE